ncbi:MAG: PUR family DNA/RNA-binding protein [Treponema sp.]|jgi:hypothetical protein|nr:PUR family DNA/RNA-binding protein [Treponema sp.]
MGARGELFTTQVYLDNRSYFFNVKENRTGDVFLQIVESKSNDGSEFDRHQIAIFSEDMQKFLQGMDKSLTFIEKDRKSKQKKQKDSKDFPKDKKTYRVKTQDSEEKKVDDGIKRTGRIHVVSKRPVQTITEENKDSDKE